MTPDDPRIEAWVTGRLSAEGAAALQRACEDPATAEAVVRAAGELAALRSALHGQDGLPPASVGTAAGRCRPKTREGRRRPRRGRSRPWLVLVGSSLALLLTLWLIVGSGAWQAEQNSQEVPPTDGVAIWHVVAVEAGMTGAGAHLVVDQQLPPGSRIVADDGSSLHLRHRSAAIDLTVTGPVRLDLVDASTIHCALGSVEARVSPGTTDQPFAITTPHARCRVAGTRFAVMVEAETTRLTVSEGRVAFQRRDASGDLGPARIVAAGASADSAATLEATTPAVAYRLHRGPRALAGSGRLPQVLPLTLQRQPTWTADGLLLDAQSHCTTPVNAPWPALRDALVASQAVTLSVRVRSRQPPVARQLLAALYIRMAEPDERRLITARLVEGQATIWYRCSVSVDPDGRMRTYQGSELVASEVLANWPPDPADQSLQIKLLEPLGHHGEPDPELAIEFADVLLFDRALTATELGALDP